MSTSVIEILKGFVTPSLISSVGPLLGVPGDAVSRGLGDTVSRYLGALVEKSGDAGAMAGIAEMANAVARDPTGLTDIKGLLAGGVPSTTAILSGNQLMGSLFGVWQASVVHKIAGTLGLKPEASSSLFNLAAPLVLSAISKRLGGGALTGAALAGLLGQERGSLLAGLVPAAGGFAVAATPGAAPVATGVAAAARPVAATAAAPAQAARLAEAPVSRRDNGLFTSFLWLILPLAFIGWLAWQKINEAAEAPAPAAAAEPAPVEAAAAPAPAAAPEVQPPPVSLARIALAGGQDIEAAADGVETKLLAFINDPAASIDKGVWFDFDRLSFETGSASLTPESKSQVANIAAILGAYPAVTVKIGGYTDNVGNPELNLALSESRARKVAEEIVALGVAADRVEAEGYGVQHAIADNGTPEGRARNRRTALSVRAK